MEQVTCISRGAELSLHMVLFDANAFDNRRFGEAGLALPDGLHMAVRKRRAEYFFGRLCARAALAPLGLERAQVGTGAMREPIWPAGVVGSITHTGTRAAAVALRSASYAGVGIDIENVADAQALRAMHGNVVSPDEVAYLRNCPQDIAILMTLVFSAKESFFKAVSSHVNRYFDFDALDLKHIDLVRRTITFTLAQTLCPQWQAGASCTVEFDFPGSGEVLTLFAW